MDILDFSLFLQIGGAIGALGAAAGPIGAGISAAVGVGQGIASIVKKARARKLAPPPEDIEQRRFLQEITRQRRGFQTGTAFQQARRQLRQQQASTQQGILRAGGGATGATLQAFARAGRGTQEAFGEIAARGQEQERFLTNLQANLLNRISQRKLSLRLLERSQALAESAQLRREAFGNVLGTAGQNLPVDQQGGGAGGFSNILDRFRQLGAGAQRIAPAQPTSAGGQTFPQLPSPTQVFG